MKLTIGKIVLLDKFPHNSLMRPYNNSAYWQTKKKGLPFFKQLFLNQDESCFMRLVLIICKRVFRTDFRHRDSILKVTRCEFELDIRTNKGLPITVHFYHNTWFGKHEILITVNKKEHTAQT